MIYIIHTCELGKMGTTIDNPSKEQLAWAYEHGFLCNVTLPTIKPKPITMVKPRVRKVETKPLGRPLGKKQPGRPIKRVEPKKE